MLRKFLSLAACLCLSTLAFSEDKKEDIERINIWIGSVTNQGNDLIGESLLNGIRLGVVDSAQFNAKVDGNLVKFRLIAKDDKGDRNEARKVAQELIDDGVSVVIGHTSTSTSLSAASLYKEKSIINIIPVVTSAAIGINISPNQFRIISDDSSLGAEINRYTQNVLKAKDVILIVENSFYGKSVASTIESTAGDHGLKIAKRFDVSTNEMDVLNNLPKIKEIKSDLYVFIGIHPIAEKYMKGLRRSGIKSPFLLTDGLCTEEVLKDSLGGDRYICAKNGRAIEQMPAWPQFMERYKKAFDTYPNIYAAYGYDAVRIFANSVAITGSTDVDELANNIRNSTAMGITGELSFKDGGDLKIKSAHFLDAKNGGWLTFRE